MALSPAARLRARFARSAAVPVPPCPATGPGPAQAPEGDLGCEGLGMALIPESSTTYRGNELRQVAATLPRGPRQEPGRGGALTQQRCFGAAGWTQGQPQPRIPAAATW